MIKASSIQTIGVVGTGLIGSGWAARCTARQLNAVAYDPSPDGENLLSRHMENAWPALERLGFDRSQAGEVAFVDSVAEVAEKSDFIQESAPDSLDVKRALIREIDRHADSETIIASSSSGLLPSEIQAGADHPERVLIGHPFNPVYILPLVEIVSGSRTSPANAQLAAQFYELIGMHPLMVQKEIDGYISDRIQEAVWREALHLVKDGVASTKDIDDAIVFGPGLRWAIMGVCLTFHLAGGEQGMKHMLEQFGPALKLPWTHLTAPELTPALIDRMVDGTREQAGERSIRELERLRDNCLIEILDVLHKYQYSAGNTQFRSG